MVLNSLGNIYGYQLSFPTSWINVSTTDLLRFTFKVLLFYIVFINIYLHSCDVIVSWYNNVKSIVMSKGRRLILLYVNSSGCTCVKVLHPLWFNVFSTCRDVIKNLLQNVNSRIHSLIYLKKIFTKMKVRLWTSVVWNRHEWQEFFSSDIFIWF